MTKEELKVLIRNQECIIDSTKSSINDAKFKYLQANREFADGEKVRVVYNKHEFFAFIDYAFVDCFLDLSTCEYSILIRYVLFKCKNNGKPSKRNFIFTGLGKIEKI